MKKLLITSVAAMALALPSMAQYYVAGDFNGWNTDPGTATAMTDLGGGMYQFNATGVSAGRHEFKIATGNWGWSTPGQNSWLLADGSGSVGFTFNSNTGISDGWRGTDYRIGVSASGNPATWTAVGDWQGWNNANAATVMSAAGNGIYSFSTELAPGAHSWKPVATGSWDSISWDGRTGNTANDDFTVSPDATQVTFFVNPLQGTIKLEMAAVPEPSTLALLGCAFAGLFCLRRRQ